MGPHASGWQTSSVERLRRAGDHAPGRLHQPKKANRMSDPFIKYIDQWDGLVAEIEVLKKTLKPLVEKEMEMRKAIVGSIDATQPIAEGTNKFLLTDMRKLKIVQKINRTIETPAIEATRALFLEQNDTGGVTFDELLRVKYELAKAEFDKLPEAAALIASRMITTKSAAPELGFT